MHAAWGLWSPEKDAGSPGVGVTGSHEPSTWVVGTEIKSQQGQQELLTAEPPPQSHWVWIYKNKVWAIIYRLNNI